MKSMTHQRNLIGNTRLIYLNSGDWLMRIIKPSTESFDNKNYFLFETPEFAPFTALE